MAESTTVFVDVEELRIGMFVYLDLGWMSHPFPSSSFKISNERQLEAIRSLDLKRVRCSVAKSDTKPSTADATQEVSGSPMASASAAQAAEILQIAAAGAARRRDQLAAQKLRFSRCEEGFSRATQACVQVMACVGAQPEVARVKSQALVHEIVDQMIGDGESMIHLLSDGSGERAALHPVNVTVISLLLGKAMQLPEPQLQALGLAALWHDAGKAQLPERVRWRDPSFTPVEDKVHQEHVALSVASAQRLGLSEAILQGIAQHHEMVDGSGFPVGVKGDAISLPARILALVNRYDNLCNPANPTLALTPHEALALIFAQHRTRFDAASLNAFVRLMGVYPPGSVVQLVDDRYALVMSVNGARPLRPQVLVYAPEVPKVEALIMNLEDAPEGGIKRSLKPLHLPQAALSYLSPRKRISYFFEQKLLPEGAGIAA